MEMITDRAEYKYVLPLTEMKHPVVATAAKMLRRSQQQWKWRGGEGRCGPPLQIAVISGMLPR